MIQRFRVPLGFVVAAAVLYLATPTGTSILLGLPIAIIGAGFRALAAGVIKKDSSLATSGPYAWTRNPLYFGSSFLAFGFAVMSWNIPAAALLLVPSAVIYPQVIRREEAHLEQLFGDDFRRYRLQVPCFLPRLRAGDISFSLAQYRMNREYNTVLGFFAAITVFAFKVTR
jgi:protein-S-isoprenylcysteine O-methyltransferase Ste14